MQLTVAEIFDIFSCMHRGCEGTLQEHNRYMAHIEMANVKAHGRDSCTASQDTPGCVKAQPRLPLDKHMF